MRADQGIGRGNPPAGLLATAEGLRMGNVDTHDLAYAAGIIDGEGSVGIYEVTPRNRPQFNVQIRVKMCDKDVVEWLADTFGGSVQVCKPYNDKCREQYSWCCTGRTARKFAEAIYPWAKCKRIHLEVILDYYNDPAHDFRIGRNNQTTKNDLISRRQYVEALGMLNRRGSEAGV
jgi:hypothetical protein